MKFAVEVCLQRSVPEQELDTLHEHVEDFLRSQRRLVKNKNIVTFQHNKHLATAVKELRVCEVWQEDNADELEFELYFYHLRVPVSMNTPNVNLTAEDNLPMFQEHILPCSEFDGIWDSLVIEEDLMARLLKYAALSKLLFQSKINTNLVSVNHVVLFHGPPGSGKTSLAKALAQKIAIREGSVGRMFSINAHSLFSKYFSESSKHVIKLFSYIKRVVEEWPDDQVVLLIDEVESLAIDRKASCSSSGNSEPGDAIRAVNAVLTQIDDLRKYDNVLVIATSNLAGSLDLAFVDRADMKIHIGFPCKAAVYKILTGAIEELQRCSILQRSGQLLDYDVIETFLRSQTSDVCSAEVKVCKELYMTIEQCFAQGVKLSGRKLRKLPFISLTFFEDDDYPLELMKYAQVLSDCVLSNNEEEPN